MVFDSTYVDLARSLLEHGAYQFDFRPETLLPPGAPALLALVWLSLGRSQAVALQLMAVFSTLGLMASYELLRRAEDRAVALVSCLLLGSSPALFMFTTAIFASDLPYFFVSILTLLLIHELDRSRRLRFRPAWVALSGLSLVAAIMFRTAGATILLGLAGWIAVAFIRSPKLGWRRLKLFCFPLVLGLSAQLIWMVWAGRREFSEWPVPGYPHSYISQLKVRNGNEPRLGMATLRDIPQRVQQNLDTYSVELVRLLTRKTWINAYWCSPFVAGVIVLTLVGLISSFLAGGGQLHDWYFTLYAITVVLWPWDFEVRFLLPVVPLLCLYLWRGGKMLWNLPFRQPLAAGIFFILGATPLTFYSVRWAVRTHLGQPLFAVGFWGLFLLAGAGIVLFRAGVLPAPDPLGSPGNLSPIAPRIMARLVLALRVAALLAVAVLSVKGVAMQLGSAHWNLTFDTTKWLWQPYIDAAAWIRTHEPANVVVMARKNDLIFHYSNHRVVWFPPTTDAQLLMQGIRKYHVSLIIVGDRDDGYWRPSPTDCFRPLIQTYPDAFRPLYRGPGYWIYEIQPAGSGLAGQ